MQVSMNDKYLFDSFAGWYGYLWRSCKALVASLLKILYSIVGGLASVIVCIYKIVAAFCRREFVASLIIGVIILFLSFGWMTSYMNGKVATRTAEYQRDSIGYKLDKMMQAYEGSSMVVIDNDTIRYGD